MTFNRRGFMSMLAALPVVGAKFAIPKLPLPEESIDSKLKKKDGIVRAVWRSEKHYMRRFMDIQDGFEEAGLYLDSVGPFPWSETNIEVTTITMLEPTVDTSIRLAEFDSMDIYVDTTNRKLGSYLLNQIEQMESDRHFYTGFHTSRDSFLIQKSRTNDIIVRFEDWPNMLRFKALLCDVST